MESKKLYRIQIKIARILLSFFLPTLSGIILYSIIMQICQEPLFWIAVLFSVPSMLLLMFFPCLLFTVSMEYLGIKLIQQPGRKINVFNKTAYLTCGMLFGIVYSIISELTASFWILSISAGVCLVTSLVKMALHIKEKECE
ncbi:hypothetical protein JXO59_07345 [candidate division KSB1 bacterium]|nr:hypothetical protein [candidate division KSB1 bacterium]